MVLRTDLTNDDPAHDLHAAQHNEANAAVLALQAAGGGGGGGAALGVAQFQAASLTQATSGDNYIVANPWTTVHDTIGCAVDVYGDITLPSGVYDVKLTCGKNSGGSADGNGMLVIGVSGIISLLNPTTRFAALTPQGQTAVGTVFNPDNAHSLSASVQWDYIDDIVVSFDMSIIRVADYPA